MIIFDCETTGLPKFTKKGEPETPLEQQPKIIEFAAIKLCDKTLEETDRLEFLVHPQEPILEKITELTGLKEADFVEAKPFADHFDKLVNFFLGERTLIAHNINFDKKLLKFEMERIFKTTRFPWPPINLCTMLSGMGLNGNKWPKLSVLYQLLFDEVFEGGHRAIVDVEATVKIARELIKREFLKI